MNNYKVLFVGGLYPKDHEKEIIGNIKRNPALAANTFQWGLVTGLDSHLTSPVTILNETFIGSYPKNYRKILFHGYKFNHCEGAEDIALSFINLTGIKNLICPFKEKKHIKKWLTKNRNDNIVVFFYGLSPAFIRTVRFIKKYFPNVSIVVDILDLIEYTAMTKRQERSIIRKWLKSRSIKGATKALRYIDGAVVVSPQIINRLNLDTDYTVVECVVESSDEPFKPIDEKRKSIVYAGSLTSKYGVLDLIHAFINSQLLDYTLDIFGDGEDRKIVEDYSKKYNNIFYHGFVSHDKIDEILTNANILINPRKSGQEFTNYSFPIKTADYLKAGRPVLGYRLEAFPPEYDEHIIYIDDFIDMSAAIKFICAKPVSELNAIGKSNYEFIKYAKNSLTQTYKIIKLFDRIYDRKNRSSDNKKEM